MASPLPLVVDISIIVGNEVLRMSDTIEIKQGDSLNLAMTK